MRSRLCESRTVICEPSSTSGPTCFSCEEPTLSCDRRTWATARGLFRFDAGFIDGFLVNGSRHVTVGSAYLSGFFDKYVIDGLVNFTGWFLQLGSRVFRRLQTGVVSQYAMVIAVGMVVLVFFYVVVALQS